MRKRGIGRTGAGWIRPLIWALAAGAMAACIGTETTNPNEEDKPVPGLAGTLVDDYGKAAEGATVKAFQEGGGSAAKGVFDSVLTDSKGRYRLTGLPEGSYNLVGEDGKRNLAVYIPRIPYQGPKVSLNLGVDTLRAPGQIQGSVTLGGKPREAVFCYLPGSSYLSISDENGGFWIANVPAGRYALKYAQTGLATATDTGVVVKPGAITKLPPREMVPDTAFPPPQPDSVWLEQDTAAGTITVRWPRAQAPDLDGYWVYRNDSGTNEPVRISDHLVKDTFFVDTVFRTPQDTVARSLTYRVKSQDRQALLSTAYSPPRTLSAAPPQMAKPLVIFTAPDTLSRGDVIRIIADFRLGAGRIDSIQWERDYNDTTLPPFRRKTIAAAEGSDTLVINVDEVSPKRLDSRRLHGQFLSLWDGAGRRWRVGYPFQVIADPPKAFAGNDTSVGVNASFTLHGRGKDRFGRIIAYYWDLDGDGQADQGSKDTGDITLKFATGGRRTLIFSVVDDDQESSSDTLILDVGTSLDFDTLPQDTLLEKSGNPYWIKRPLTIPLGRRMELGPGVVLRFWPKAGLDVRGILIAHGGAGDSVRFEAQGNSYFSPPGTSYGLRFLCEEAPNPVRDTASSLTYVSFRDSKLGIQHCRPRIENSGFRSGYIDSSSLGVPAMAFYSSSRPRGEWVCRNNSFTGFPIYIEVNDLARVPASPAVVNGIVRFEGNAIAGDMGPRVENSNRDSAIMEFTGNTLSIQATGTAEHSGFELSGTSRVMVSGNRVSGADQAILVRMVCKAQISGNDFIANRTAFRLVHGVGDGFMDYSGRFHHNRVSGSSESAFSFAVHTTGVFDSNWVSADAGVPFVRDEYRDGGSALHAGKDIDMRANYWTLPAGPADAASVQGNIQVSQAAADRELGKILVEPVLAAPPAGAGRP
ncbi:MAG: hypothetical protein JWO30_4949 [Fibrobacteres bacterium]|nr:hypothetical protein [Fibrobacterota bacterium]